MLLLSIKVTAITFHNVSDVGMNTDLTFWRMHYITRFSCQMCTCQNSHPANYKDYSIYKNLNFQTVKVFPVPKNKENFLKSSLNFNYSDKPSYYVQVTFSNQNHLHLFLNSETLCASFISEFTAIAYHKPLSVISNEFINYYYV